MTCIKCLKRLETIFKPAKDVRKDFIMNLYSAIKLKCEVSSGVVSERQQPSFVELVAKYNLLLSQGGAIEVLGESFVFSSCKWAVMEFVSKIIPTDLSDTIVCKETL